MLVQNPGQRHHGAHLRCRCGKRGHHPHDHPPPAVVQLGPGEEHPLVGGLDLDLEPPLIAENMGFGVVGRRGVHCEEVEDRVSAVRDGTS